MKGTASELASRARRELPRILRAAGESKASVSVIVVGPQKIAALSARYRGKRKPTDVLSFPPPAPVREVTGFLGEIVICSTVLRRQALELGHRPEQELLVLLVHGLLHLQGYDHERSPRASREMAAQEAKVLKRLDSKLSGLIRRA